MVILGEHPEPRPTRPHARVLPIEGMRHRHPSRTRLHVRRPYGPRSPQLNAQCRHQGLRQHHHPVLGPLALPNDQRPLAEVHILDPQLKSLRDPQAAPVQQLSQQLMLARHHPQHLAHFVHRQHHRQATLAPRMTDLSKPGQLLAQHLAIEEEQGGQGLAVGGRCDRAIIGQVREKRLHIGAAQLGRMTKPMKADESLDPVDVHLFGAWALVQKAQPLAKLT